MADANEAAIRYWKETTWGEVTGTPKFTDLRFTSDSLKGEKNTEVSEEIDDSRQIPDVIRTGLSASGDINFELSMVTFEDWILALLMAAAWSAEVAVITATSVAIVAATGTFTATWSTPPTVGQWVKVVGSALTNDGHYKIATSAAGEFTVSNKDDLVDETIALTITEGRQAVNGVTEHSFSIEREWTQLSNVFQIYNGMEIAGLSLDIPANGSKITGTWNFLGKQETAAAATAGDGSPTAQNTNRVLSAANDVAGVLEAYGNLEIMNGSVGVTNNLREDRKVGQLSLRNIGKGRIAVTGGAGIYFEDNIIKNKYLLHTESGIALVFQDSTGKSMIMEIPSFKYSDDDTNAGAVDAVSVENVEFEAHKNATELVTIRVAVWAA